MPNKEEKVQRTLDSFFGLKTQKQTTLKGFIKKKEKENTTNETEAVSTELDKRRQYAILDDDSSDEEVEQNVPESPRKKSKIDNEEQEAQPTEQATKKTQEPSVSTTTTTTSKKSELEDSSDEEVEQNVSESPRKKSKIDNEEQKAQPTEQAAKKTQEAPLSTNTTTTSKKSENAGNASSVEEMEHSSSTDATKTKSRLAEVARGLAKSAKVETEVEELSSPVPYSELAKAFEEIEATTKRLEIQSILTKLLRRILQHCPEDLHSVVYLASNSIAPAYDCVELGIGDSILEGAVAQAYGTDASK
jgi:DNA ligase-1